VVSRFAWQLIIAALTFGVLSFLGTEVNAFLFGHHSLLRPYDGGDVTIIIPSAALRRAPVIYSLIPIIPSAVLCVIAFNLTQVPVHRGRHILVLPSDRILWFEVEYRLVYAHIDGDRYMTNFTLKDLEERLDPEAFFRAHKSRLVNLNHVRAIVPRFGGRFKLVMHDQKGSEVELSRAQARELRGRMHW
jgi:DNA-binding LytR/AlgR family response regulator